MKVISFGSLYSTDAILSLLDKAANDGHWLVFNNCHLMERWDDKLLGHLIEMIYRSTGRCSKKYLFN